MTAGVEHCNIEVSPLLFPFCCFPCLLGDKSGESWRVILEDFVSGESGHIFLRGPASGESCRTVFLATGSGESRRASRGEATTSYTSSPSSSPSSVELFSSSNKRKMLFKTTCSPRATSYPFILIYGCQLIWLGFMTVQTPLPPSVLHLSLVLKASSRLTSSGRSSINSAI